MSVLSAAVVLVGLIGLLNLLLTFGIIRRLRDQPATHRHAGRPAATIRPTTIEDGEQVAAVDAVTIDGTPVQLPAAGRSLVGFFSPSCSTCREQIIPFVVMAERQWSDRPVVAVVAGPADEEEAASAYVAELLAGRSEVLIIREDENGPVQKAFGVKGFPSIALLEDGELRACDFQVSALPLGSGS